MDKKNKVFQQRQRRTYSSLDDDRTAKNVYISTYKNDFKGEIAPAAGGRRPRTSWIYSKDVKMSCHIPIYNNEFKVKPARKTEAIRTGSSSGCRRNNPHPLQSFLVWRFASDEFDKLKKQYKNPADREMLEKVFLDQLKTTYQEDYNGLQKGIQIKSCHNGDWKPRPEHTPKYSFTSTRHAFRPPRLWPELAQKRTHFRHTHKIQTRIII